MPRPMSKRQEQQMADRMFLEACIEELDEGGDLTVVVPTRSAQRRVRAQLQGRDRVRVVVGDPAAAIEGPVTCKKTNAAIAPGTCDGRCDDCAEAPRD